MSDPIKMSGIDLTPKSPMVLLRLQVLGGIVARMIEEGGDYIALGIATSSVFGDDPLLCLLKSDKTGEKLDEQLYAAQCRNISHVAPKVPQ